LQHTGTINPKRSRIRVFIDGDTFFPVIASKRTVITKEKEYNVPAKPIFREPETGIPLRCDLCGPPPDPQCVKVCLSGALVFEE
jgi:benzoyl-CoA reductase subunit BamC